MIEPAKWDELVVPRTKQDFAVINAVQMGLPSDWMNRSPNALVCGGAILAVRYERACLADGVRNHILFHDKPPEIVRIMEADDNLSRLVALFDRMFLDFANDIEVGEVK